MELGITVIAVVVVILNNMVFEHYEGKWDIAD